MGEDGNTEVRAMPSARSGELRSEPVPVSALRAPATIADAERVAQEAAACIKPELFEPALRNVGDQLYVSLMDAVQDYLIDNTQWNIREQIEVHKRQAYNDRVKLVEAVRRVEELTALGRFLLDRLADHEVRMTSETDAREWAGHVTPPMARFRAALASTDRELEA